jgi:hypothetical protein
VIVKKDIKNSFVIVLSALSIMYLAEGAARMFNAEYRLAMFLFIISLVTSGSALGWHFKKRLFLWIGGIAAGISIVYGVAEILSFAPGQASSPAILLYLLFVLGGVSSISLAFGEIKRN